MKKSTLYAGFVFLLMLALVVTGCSTTETSTTIPEENTAGMVEQKEQKRIPKVDEKLVARLHLDDVKNIPSYTVHAYVNGDVMPVANGNTMNCTYPTCYQVIFDVDGSDQSLERKLQDRSILDESYKGASAPTTAVQYWTKDMMITARFYQ